MLVRTHISKVSVHFTLKVGVTCFYFLFLIKLGATVGEESCALHSINIFASPISY
jgi:hypothetical protein